MKDRDRTPSFFTSGVLVSVAFAKYRALA